MTGVVGRTAERCSLGLSRPADRPRTDLLICRITAGQAAVDRLRSRASRFGRVHHRTSDPGSSVFPSTAAGPWGGAPHGRTTTGSQVQRPRRGNATRQGPFPARGRVKGGCHRGGRCDPGGARTFSRQRLSVDSQPAGSRSARRAFRVPIRSPRDPRSAFPGWRCTVTPSARPSHHPRGRGRPGKQKRGRDLATATRHRHRSSPGGPDGVPPTGDSDQQDVDGRPARAPGRIRRTGRALRRDRRHSALAALSGLLLVLAFPPYGVWQLSLVSVAALALLTRGRRVRPGARGPASCSRCRSSSGCCSGCTRSAGTPWSACR